MGEDCCCFSENGRLFEVIICFTPDANEIFCISDGGAMKTPLSTQLAAAIVF